MNADVMAFTFFDYVWLRIDEDGNSPGVGQVIGILHKPIGYLYQVQWGVDRVGYHYEQELTKTKPQEFINHGH